MVYCLRDGLCRNDLESAHFTCQAMLKDRYYWLNILTRSYFKSLSLVARSSQVCVRCLLPKNGDESRTAQRLRNAEPGVSSAVPTDVRGWLMHSEREISYELNGLMDMVRRGVVTGVRCCG